jgi:hypothetical protein
MQVKIHISRMVLENGNFSVSQLRCLRAEIETELANLLIDNGIPYDLQLVKTISNLVVDLNSTDNSSSTINLPKLAQNIAHCIYSELVK